MERAYDLTAGDGNTPPNMINPQDRAHSGLTPSQQRPGSTGGAIQGVHLLPCVVDAIKTPSYRRGGRRNGG